MLSALTTEIIDLKEELVYQTVESMLSTGENPFKIIEESKKAMEVVGNRFASGEYFLPELIYSAEIFKRITELVKPKIDQNYQNKKIGKLVIGTVQGDIHDLGKNIVVFWSNISGFEVYDLGVDVQTEEFVRTVRRVKPDILGLSGLLTVAYESMKEIIDCLVSAGLRQKVKVIIGGGAVDESVCSYVRADYYARDAVSGMSRAKKWITDR